MCNASRVPTTLAHIRHHILYTVPVHSRWHNLVPRSRWKITANGFHVVPAWAHIPYFICVVYMQGSHAGIFFFPVTAVHHTKLALFWGSVFFIFIFHKWVTQQRCKPAGNPIEVVSSFLSICSDFASLVQCKLDGTGCCVNKGAQCRPLQERQSNDKDASLFVCLFTANNTCFVLVITVLCSNEHIHWEWFSWTNYLAPLWKNWPLMSQKVFFFS